MRIRGEERRGEEKWKSSRRRWEIMQLHSPPKPGVITPNPIERLPRFKFDRKAPPAGATLRASTILPSHLKRHCSHLSSKPTSDILRTMRLPLLFLALLALLPSSPAARSSATSFCKCICFNNSTIIALNPPSSSSNPSPSASPSQRSIPPREDKKAHTLTCADCNRAFCLSYNLPICKDATEENVFTTCFQRDSVKDETVVIVFLIATAGLVGWAVLKPWVVRVREGGLYLKVPTTTGGGSGGIAGRGVGIRGEREDGEQGRASRENGNEDGT